MGTANKVVASTLAVTGGATLYAVDVDAKDGHTLAQSDTSFISDEELNHKEVQTIEKALRQYTNPLHRIDTELEHDGQDTVTYEINEGDTLSHIAQEFDIPVEEIAYENDLDDKHALQVGQKLTIRVKEKSYQVRYRDSLDAIAKAHDISLDKLLSHNPDIEEQGKKIYPGQRLNIPTPAPTIEAPPEEQEKNTTTVASAEEEQSAADEEQTEANDDPATESTSPSTVSASSASFVWPLEGEITSTFGTRWGRMHNGIDITHGDSNAPIQAAKAGVVTEASSQQGGYGNLVIIDHGNGKETYYAHLSRIDVGEGQEIGQGEVLGRMGATGNTTGPHLHFEIRIDQQPVDPLKHLP